MFFFFLNKVSAVSMVTHHVSLQRHDEPHKPTRSLALIEFARGLNPNVGELNLHHPIGEFARKGLSQSWNRTRQTQILIQADKSQRNEIVASQQRFHFSLMAGPRRADL